MEHVRDHVADAPGCVRAGTGRHIVDRNDDGKLHRVCREEEQPQRAITPRVLANELIDAVKNFSVRAERCQEIVVGGPARDGRHSAESIREPAWLPCPPTQLWKTTLSVSLPVDDHALLDHMVVSHARGSQNHVGSLERDYRSRPARSARWIGTSPSR